MLQLDLFTILVKFRLNEIAFSADIQQMYRQILIDQEDQNFQRIVWRESKDSPIREYKLCTEFNTLLTQVEAILNSRPLVSLDCDNDPDSLNILTPSHFLIGEVITSSPEHTNDDKLSLRSHWDIVQKMKLNFWRKWKIDYLNNLQNRTKWKSPNNNFKVGEIVIIKEDNIPPATWPLGKLIETHPDKDGVVTLRTVKGPLKRPIHKLCKLPLHQE
ncbi:DUF5641 domain-containing protein [Trichonephila clavipes]|nr:DUF5641 domain-containing protein [Trichonephila clavipes]